MSPSTRHSLLLLSLIVVFGGLVGFRLTGIPFIPDAIYSDALTAHWSAATFARETILAGDYPLWRETIFTGVPFAANPLNKSAYPPQWLLWLLPAAWHINIMIVLHTGIAAGGMWAWARASHLRGVAVMFAALMYALAPRMVATLGAGHLDIFYAMAWLPWLLWLLHQSPDKQRLLWLLQVAMVAALVFLADVRISLFGFLFAGVYALWQRKPERIGLAALAVVPFLLLIVAQLVPLLSWQPYLSRTSLTVEDAGNLSLDPLGMAGLLLPPHDGGGGFEVMAYLTLPVLVLMLIGLLTRPRGEMVFWGLVMLITVLWSLGENTLFWRTLAQFEPLRWFRVPGRAWLIIVLIAPILAAHGLQTLMQISDRWREEEPPKYVFWLRLVAAGSAGLFAVCGVTLLVADMVGLPQSAAALMLFDGVAIGAVLLIVLLRRGRAAVVAWSFVLIAFADAAITGVQWLEWRDTDEWLEPHAALADYLIADDVDRVYSPSYALPQEVAEHYDLRLFYGVDPFQLRAFVDVIEAASNVPVDAYSIVLPPLTGVETDEDVPFANESIVPDVALLADWRVSHVIAAYEIASDDLTLVQTINGVNVYRNALYDVSVPAPELLPAETIDRLHRLTLISVWVSAVTWVMVGAAITVLSWRQHSEAVT